MRDAYSEDDIDDDDVNGGLAVDDWGNEYYSSESYGFDDVDDDDVDDSEYDYEIDDSEYYDDSEFDDSEYLDDGESFDDEAMPEYSDEDDFMVGFTDAAPELAESLREVMNERYADGSSEEFEQALENLFSGMSAAEGFNFGKVLRSIGRGANKILRNPVVSQVAKTALPIAGGALGTLVGGPIGTALGSQLGNLAGSAFGPRPRRRPRTRRRRVARPVRRAPRRITAPAPAAAQPGPAGGSTAAAQLLQLTQNPNVLRSLLSLALGNRGRDSVDIADGTTVPVGTFMTLLKTLSAEAAADADQLARESLDSMHGESQDSMSYMKDEAGDFIVDPAVPEARAEVLYETLMAAEEERFAADGFDGYSGEEDEYLEDEFDDNYDDADDYDEVIGG